MSIPSSVTPTVFPTEHILIVTLLSFVAYLLIATFYCSIKQKNALLNNGAIDKDDKLTVTWVLVAAFALRVVLSHYIVGHAFDIRCFVLWGERAASQPFSTFYTGGFADYPPGYIYILGLMSKISSFFGHSVYLADGSYDLVNVLLIKLPSILADLAASYIVYKLARKKLRFAPSVTLMALVAFNPVFSYISGAWGQIDMILSFLLVCSALLLINNKPIWSGVVYGLSILMKPQALMMGPLLALAFILYVFDDNFFDAFGVKCKDGRIIRLFKTFIAVICACTMIVVTAIPFGSEEMPWYEVILQKYLGTATSYDYATINAYNFYALIGANWKKVGEIAFLGISYEAMGIAGMAFSVGFSAFTFIIGRKKNKGAFFLSAAYLFASIFTIGHYMHERYIVPVLLMLIVAYVYYSDKRLLYLAVGYTLPILLNCVCAFYYSQLSSYRLYWDERLVTGCSVITVLAFCYFTFVVVKIMLKNKVKEDVFQLETN